MKVLGVIAVIGLVVFGAVSIYRSSLFEIVRVDVVGNTRLTADRVREIAAVPPGATLLRFPGGGMVERLEADPWIAEATVTRDFPDGVRVRVVERVPVARIDTGSETLWLVDREGWVVAEQSAEQTSSLIVIRDLEDIEPMPGVRSGSDVLRNALAVWEGISDELRVRTRIVSAPSIDKTALVTTDDIEVFIGSADDIAKKDLVVRSILEEQAGKVVYINVRSVDRPTYRGIDTQ